MATESVAATVAKAKAAMTPALKPIDPQDVIVILKFKHSYSPHSAGDEAGFSVDVASRLTRTLDPQTGEPLAVEVKRIDRNAPVMGDCAALSGVPGGPGTPAWLTERMNQARIDAVEMQAVMDANRDEYMKANFGPKAKA